VPVNTVTMLKKPIQWIPGALSPGVKRTGREDDNSPQSNAEVKNAWSCASAPTYAFMAWYLVKAQVTSLRDAWLSTGTLLSPSI
jgi:hypothetical protein